jgi:muramoyltetrapeptide carboxypeptidase LdcA involved in peptidoglycan recycling
LLEEYNAPTINVWNDLQVLRHNGAFDRIAGLIVGPVEGISILEGTASLPLSALTAWRCRWASVPPSTPTIP